MASKKKLWPWLLGGAAVLGGLWLLGRKKTGLSVQVLREAQAASAGAKVINPGSIAPVKLYALNETWVHVLPYYTFQFDESWKKYIKLKQYAFDALLVDGMKVWAKLVDKFDFDIPLSRGTVEGFFGVEHLFPACAKKSDWCHHLGGGDEDPSGGCCIHKRAMPHLYLLTKKPPHGGAAAGYKTEYMENGVIKEAFWYMSGEIPLSPNPNPKLKGLYSAKIVTPERPLMVVNEMWMNSIGWTFMDHVGFYINHDVGKLQIKADFAGIEDTALESQVAFNLITTPQAGISGFGGDYLFTEHCLYNFHSLKKPSGKGLADSIFMTAILYAAEFINGIIGGILSGLTDGYLDTSKYNKEMQHLRETEYQSAGY